MLKHVALACLALAFATQAAAESVIEKAKRQAQEQKQQQKAGAGQSAPSEAGKNPTYKKKSANCNRQADARKLGSDARKRHVDACMKT